MGIPSLPPESIVSSKIRRFRSNPVEIAIFSVITLVFCNSIYSLFNDGGSFQTSALTPMAANPVSEGRSPASAAANRASFANLDVACAAAVPASPPNKDGKDGDDAESENDTPATGRAPASLAEAQTVSAAKVRLTGAFCGATDPSQLTQITIVNKANKFAAAVFSDVNTGKYSTDYIPLNAGKNPIRVDFAYRDGKTVSRELDVQNVAQK
jgi:hypothetical protein